MLLAVLSLGSIYYAVQVVAVAFQSVDKNQKCDHSIESCWEVSPILFPRAAILFASAMD